MEIIECYDFFELRIRTDTEPSAVFSNGEKSVEIRGFRVSDTSWAIRFMPDCEGVWQYRVVTSDLTGQFECVPNTGENHGPAITDSLSFEYADGAPYVPVGTTCYAWIHQTPEVIAQTLETLGTAPFNKIRMCVFPKSMPYNNNDPESYPFLKDPEGKWDVTKLDFRFWDHLDTMLTKLCDLDIEADLILFHPYDRWGFSTLSIEECLTYLDYCIRRLSAYRNIWWSLANEYDLMPARKPEDWDAFGKKLQAEDPYHHLISVHHCLTIFPKKDWLTHCSLQTGFIKRTAEWRTEYGLPAIIDECGYEGDIEFDWGNLSAFELVHRAWTTVTSGGFITHGETFRREDEVLWWAKGGKLYGQSPERFAFLKSIQYELGKAEPFQLPEFFTNPNEAEKEGANEEAAGFAELFGKILCALPEFDRRLFMMQFTPAILRNADYRLQYLGRQCPCIIDIQLPEAGRYKVEILDVWEMTRKVAEGEVQGNLRISLPGKEGMAVLVTRLAGEAL